MALYHVAKFSTPLPTNLISTRSQYGREIANVQIPLPSWQSVPNPSFVELTSGLVYACGTDVSNYSAATDEFRVTPTYSLPAWLSLTTIGSGAGNLTTNGNQLDANDIPANPGIRIDVRRSGGAWVSSQPFGVTVSPVPSNFGAWSPDMTTYFDIGPEAYMQNYSPTKGNFLTTRARVGLNPWSGTSRGDPAFAYYSYVPHLGGYGQFVWDPEWNFGFYLPG